MKYLFRQNFGNVTILAIVENPRVENGTVYAKKVGEFVGWSNNKEMFEACTPVEFIAGGGLWNMTEYTDQL